MQSQTRQNKCFPKTHVLQLTGFTSSTTSISGYSVANKSESVQANNVDGIWI